MAFKIDTNIYKTQAQKPQEPILQPSPKEQEPSKEQITKKLQNTGTMAPLGTLSSNKITPSNSAFSSLFLGTNEWLNAEFGDILSAALADSNTLNNIESKSTNSADLLGANALAQTSKSAVNALNPNLLSPNLGADSIFSANSNLNTILPTSYTSAALPSTLGFSSALGLDEKETKKKVAELLKGVNSDDESAISALLLQLQGGI